MLLVLARHGNTFEAGDTVVWVGARTDLPLTAKGKEQASALGQALLPVAPHIGRIVSGPLKRTREHAEIASAVAGLRGTVEIDERLREIDYGLWEGKTSDEIEAAFGTAELDAWNAMGRWPRTPGWSPSEDAVTENVRTCAGSLAGNGAGLVVTSNGILKFFLKLVPGLFDEMAESRQLKVATGHCCAMRFAAGRWHMLAWNRRPEELSLSSLID